MPRDAELLSIPKDTKIGSEVDDRLWRRFTFLPNLNGQKYTLSNTYTSREEQGEFIFCNSAAKNSGVESPQTGLEISVENNKYFASPVYGGSRIFINEVEIREKTELEYGQTLTLDNKTFRFKEREDQDRRHAPREVLQKEKARLRDVISKMPTFEGEFTPGQNWLILSQILSYLPIKELKRVRFVARNWNEEAFKLLRKTAPLYLDFSSGYARSQESMRLFRYSVEMGDKPLSNLYIEMTDIGVGPICWLDPSPGKPGAKFLDDLNLFILNGNPVFQSIKHLRLEGFMKFQLDCEIRTKLLQTLGKSLKELTWSGHWALEGNSGDRYTFPENTELKELQVFTLSMRDHKCLINPGNLAKWLQNLANSIQTVDTLRLDNFAEIVLTFMNIVQDSVSRKLFPNLTALDLSPVNPEIVRILLQMEKPLKKLGLRDYCGMKREDFPLLDELLLKHAPSLESLEFVLPMRSWTVEGGDVYLNFPAFPKLKRLRVVWDSKSYGPSAQLLAKLRFPGGRINYGRDLPSLQSLFLNPQTLVVYNSDRTMSVPLSRSNVAWFYETFFPVVARDYGGEPEVCSSLQRLDIIHEIRGNGPSPAVDLFLEAAETGIAAMFPNVHNPWINSVRERAGMKIETGITLENKSPELISTSDRQIPCSTKKLGRGSGDEEY